MSELSPARLMSVSLGWLSPGGIILPKNPIFHPTLNQSLDCVVQDDLKFGKGNNILVPDSNGLLRQLDGEKGTDEYLQSGEWEESLEQNNQIEEQEIFFNTVN